MPTSMALCSGARAMATNSMVRSVATAADGAKAAKVMLTFPEPA